MRWRDFELRVSALFKPRRIERELTDELDFHLHMQARKHQAAGVDGDEAMRLARIEFGNVDLVKEDARDVRGFRQLEEIRQDIRYAIRGFRRSPTFALTVVLTVGLGIGLNASVFTLFDAYVLRPFEVRDPYTLYSVAGMDRAGRVHDFGWRDYQALGRGNPAFSDVVAFRTVGARLRGSPATGELVSGDFFRMLGVRAALGRLILPDGTTLDGGGGERVVVLANSAWRQRFGADSAILGQRILLHGNPFVVIGVAQPGFDGLFKRPRDFWVPLAALSDFDPTAKVNGANQPELFSLLGRLAPGVSRGRGTAAMTASIQSLTAGRADSTRAVRALLWPRATAIPLTATTVLAFIPIGLAFALVLLLVCANVANMMLARGLARQREMGVRLALGASRRRLIRQLLTESLLLAFPAVCLGFGLSWLTVDIGVRSLFASLPPDLIAFVRLVPLHPDVRVLAFTVAAALMSAAVFGLAPALNATKMSVVQATRGGFGADYSPSRLRDALVVIQVTVAALLLITSCVLLREAARLGRTETGLRTRDVLSIEPEARSRRDVLARLSASPLVDAIAAAATLPLDARFPTVAASSAADSNWVSVGFNLVSASYFTVLQIPLVRGRGFSSAEERGAGSVVVGEATAKQLWPRGNALGGLIHLRLRDAADQKDSLAPYQDARVVGIARDVVTQGVENGKDHPIVYFPLSVEAPTCCLLARVRGDPAAAKQALDADLERGVPGGVDRIDRLETFVAGDVYPYRAAYWVSLALGVIALALTLMGVYGVVAYLVGQRMREIGIRIALGATHRDVLALTLAQSVRHALTGIGVGGLLALVVARILASNIEHMPTFDIVAFGGASICIFVACVGAAFLPSRRATAIDPTVTLRED